MEERDNKLYLADDRRCQMGAAVGSYFLWMFRNEEDNNGNSVGGTVREKEDKNRNSVDGVATGSCL